MESAEAFLCLPLPRRGGAGWESLCKENTLKKKCSEAMRGRPETQPVSACSVSGHFSPGCLNSFSGEAPRGHRRACGEGYGAGTASSFAAETSRPVAGQRRQPRAARPWAWVRSSRRRRGGREDAGREGGESPLGEGAGPGRAEVAGVPRERGGDSAQPGPRSVPRGSAGLRVPGSGRTGTEDAAPRAAGAPPARAWSGGHDLRSRRPSPARALRAPPPLGGAGARAAES